MVFFFFFSSRRRHTRFSRDWSSDVCSSDLRGGMTSHAAVVARGMGKCCVAGCGGISVNYGTEQFVSGDVTVKKGDIITLDGSTGEVMLGQVRSEEHTSELQSRENLVCRLLLEKK